MIQAKTMLGMVTTAALFGSGHAATQPSEPTGADTRDKTQLKYFTYKESDIFEPKKDFVCRGVTNNSIQDSNMNCVGDGLGLYDASTQYGYVGSRAVSGEDLRINEAYQEVKFETGQRWKICSSYDIYRGRTRTNTGNKICCIFKLGQKTIDRLFWMESSRIVTHFNRIVDDEDKAKWKDDTYDEDPTYYEPEPAPIQKSAPKEEKTQYAGEFPDSDKVQALIDRLEQNENPPTQVQILESASESTDEREFFSLIQQKPKTSGPRRTPKPRKQHDTLVPSLEMITEAPEASDTNESGSEDEDEKRSQASTPPPTPTDSKINMDALKAEVFALGNAEADLTETDPRAAPTDAPVAAEKAEIGAKTYFARALRIKAAEKGQDIMEEPIIRVDDWPSNETNSGDENGDKVVEWDESPDL